MSKRLSRLLVAALLVLAACKKDPPPAPPTPTPTPTPQPTPPPTPPSSTADNDHILLGNPTNAVTTPDSSTNYFKNNNYYKIAYHASRGIPVWVAWHLESSDLGSTPRQDDFRPDGLPAIWYAVTTGSYSGSGFDRGHNVPSADRTASVAANSSTFLMTNIIPQAPRLNQGPWEGLEDQIRNTLVGTNKEAWIVMGNHGTGGRGNNDAANTIDNGNVTVPWKIWKVALIIPKGSNDLSRIDTSAQVLAVNMPNDNTLYNTTASGKLAWRNYLTTISDLEADAAASGVRLNILRNLPADVRNYLRTKPFRQ